MDIAKLHTQMLDAALPVEAGIYDTGTEIRCHAQLTPDQQAQFDQIVAQWRIDGPKAEALDGLWSHVNGLYKAEKVSKGWDENAEGRVLLWEIAGEITPERKAMMAAIGTWGDTAWQLYYQVRAKLEAGEPYELPSLPAPCPYHFADVLFASDAQ